VLRLGPAPHADQARLRQPAGAVRPTGDPMSAVDAPPAGRRGLGTPRAATRRDPDPTRRTGTTNSLHRRERRWAAAFIAPVVIGFVLFAVLPFTFSLYAAFTNWNGLSVPTFTGLENFRLKIGRAHV